MTYFLVFSLTMFMFWLGNKSGYRNGYIAGRRELRRQYEKAGR